MSVNDIIDKVFDATAKLELMQTLIGDLINKTEKINSDTPESAMCFAIQQDTIVSFLHIALDGICDSIKLLEEVQKKGGELA